MPAVGHHESNIISESRLCPIGLMPVDTEGNGIQEVLNVSLSTSRGNGVRRNIGSDVVLSVITNPQNKGGHSLGVLDCGCGRLVCGDAHRR